ncbi:MAG: TIGR02221 family CRISPR-associated protein, partial [Gloeomargarita sp. SKYBB_i_bin120]|nr:TIGR02221 family CRISPR-associated protein [Gloeomargarita sp. SKYB120]MDW8178564.1 TIGR02221 family CRISPR-associated protein [Gloeomargarita sp. SKYBB_i_bin120]
ETMTTLLTFLGTGSNRTVTYCWWDGTQEKQCQTHLFPIAACEFFQPQRILLAATQEVLEGRGKPNYEAFQKTLSQQGKTLELIHIPDGKFPDDLWTIFDQITESIQLQEKLLLDVTHAFRSLPMLALAVAAYLRRTKDVCVERILYGAYEARQPFRDPPEPQDQAPVFDLTSILDLLDWLGGAEALLKRGDARVLAERMEQTHRQLWKQPQGDERPYHLQRVANRLSQWTQALYLVRPLDVMEIAQQLLPELQNAQQEFQRWAKPFAVIVEQVQQEIQPLAYERPKDLSKQQLRCQLALINYCLQKGLVVQAITLAREWVVSWMFLVQEEGNWLNSDERENMEKALGASVELWCKKDKSKEADVPLWLRTKPYACQIAKVWNALRELRNDVAHGGMRKDRSDAKTISKRAQQIPEWLQALLEGTSLEKLGTDQVVIDLGTLYEGTAKLEALPDYIARAKELAGQGKDVILTGQAPIWMYLAIAHGLHGVARRLCYDSPVTGRVLIFDHCPA